MAAIFNHKYNFFCRQFWHTAWYVITLFYSANSFLLLLVYLYILQLYQILTGLDLTPAIAGQKNTSPFQNTITSTKLPPKTKTKYEIWGKYRVLEVWLLSFSIDIIYDLHIWGVSILYIHLSVRQLPTFLPNLLNLAGNGHFVTKISWFEPLSMSEKFDSRKQTCSTKQTHKTIKAMYNLYRDQVEK